jgi:hypothetical protein
LPARPWRRRQHPHLHQVQVLLLLGPVPALRLARRVRAALVHHVRVVLVVAHPEVLAAQ